MFTADAFIDTVQTGKKTWVNTFVTNELVKDAMIKFIDNQADYTKKAFKATTDAATTVAWARSRTWMIGSGPPAVTMAS